MKKIIISSIIGMIFFISCERVSSQEIQSHKNENRVENLLGIPSEVSHTETICILLRHAEKENVGTDPNLNNNGVLRAVELKRLLSNVIIGNIYSTPFNRTRQTVRPLAVSKEVAITEYDPSLNAQQFINNVLVQNRGKIVVIVGHSNTIPEMIKVLSNNVVRVSISESEFDNLYIARSSTTESPSIIQKKYGQSTP